MRSSFASCEAGTEREREQMIDFDDLTTKEKAAIARLRKLAKTWPKTLALFSNSGTLEVHRCGDGEPYTGDTLIDEVYGITNDGGDRDD